MAKNPKDVLSGIASPPSERQEAACHAHSDIDIKENDILAISPELLSILLTDHTTHDNIFWATDNYAHLGAGYQFSDPITIESITGENGNVIVPRSLKSRQQQQRRSREMAEVFTPSWICNKQNNLIDNAWFGRENVFNTEIDNPDGTHTWKKTEGKIEFPEGKTWRDYVTENRMEITCGEAPYLASRYDTVTGEPIPVDMRIGLLDRKLRIVSENTDKSGEWLAASKAALRSVYGYEWQGDNLILARENLLYTILDHYKARFGRNLPNRSLPGLAYIISWNLWQMDGLKGVIPNSCGERKTVTKDLFGETVTVSQCQGCRDGDIRHHNGTYAMITDWPNDITSSRVNHKTPIRFIDLIK